MTRRISADDLPPPHDLRAEESVLASLLVDEDAFDVVQGIVTADDFYREAHRRVFEACAALWARGESINEITVAHGLGAHLDDAGGLPFLARITTELPTAVGVEHYAGIVQRMALYRRAIQSATEIVQLAYTRPQDADGFLAECEAKVGALATRSANDLTPLRALLEDFWAEPGVGARETRMLRTGLYPIDKILSGVEPGNMCVVAARPGMGKSNLLLTIMRNAVIGQKFRAALVSLEMSGRENVVRLLGQQSGVTGSKIRNTSLNDEEQRLVYGASMELAELPIDICEKPLSTVEKIRSRARRVRAAQGLDLLVVDYLQLVSGSSRRFGSRWEEVGAISRGLKMLAMEMDIPVLVASQLNREVEKRNPPKPMLSDLRESGSVEQDADQVLGLYRKDKYATREEWESARKEPYPEGVVWVSVLKNRHGPTGTATIRINDQTGLCEDLEPVPSGPAPWAR